MDNFPNNNNNSSGENETPEYVGSYSGGYSELGSQPPMAPVPEKNGLSLYSVIVLIIITAVVTFQVTSLWYNKGVLSSDADYLPPYFESVLTVDEYLRAYYIGIDEMDEEYVSQFLCAALLYASGDAYAAYYSPEEYKNASQSLEGNSAGVGISIEYRDDLYIGITKVYKGSPASNAGIKVGDIVVAIDGKDVLQMNYKEINDAFQGEAGAAVQLTVKRGDDLVDFTVIRDVFVMQTVDSHMYKDGATSKKVGVVQILNFNNATTVQFKDAVNALIEEGAEALVFDVRGNPGGNLDSVVAMLDFLLPEGKIVRITDRNGREVQSYSSDASCIDLPMAVLTDGETASAAELFASALKDFDKAITVGTQSFGKGTMQIMIPLPDGGAFKFSYRYYSPPISDNFHGVGITPDIEVTLPEGTLVTYLTDETDGQLSAAVDHLLS